MKLICYSCLLTIDRFLLLGDLHSILPLLLATIIYIFVI